MERRLRLISSLSSSSSEFGLEEWDLDTLEMEPEPEPEPETMESVTYSALMRKKPKIETEHGVIVSVGPVVWVADLTTHHFSPHLYGHKLEELAIDILNSSCFFLSHKINNGEDEKKLDEQEYILCRCIVENEAFRCESIPKSILRPWLLRVEKEYENATTGLTRFCEAMLPTKETLMQHEKALAPLVSELKKVRLPALRAYFASGQQNGNFSDCYNELQQWHALVAKMVQRLYPLRHFDEFRTIGSSHVGEVVSSLTGIPISVLPAFSSPEIGLIGEHLRERLVDQDRASDAICRTLICGAPLPPDFEMRPRASLLFLGPSGVGKTEAAKCIAEVFFVHPDRLIRINMSDYGELNQESDFEWLIEAIGEKPDCLLLFEKIEKCHPCVIEILVDIARGELKDKDGNSVYLHKSIVIMTSNVVGTEELQFSCTCSDVVKQQMESYPGIYDHMADCCTRQVPEEAQKTFGPMLLNSLDRVVVFDDLLDVGNITRLLLREKARAISENRLIVYPSIHLLDVVSKNYTKQPVKAGKAIQKWLDENVEPALCGIAENLESIGSTVYIDTLVGTEELSYRLENTDLPEEWMAKELKMSLKKMRHLYKWVKALYVGMLQTKACLFRFSSATADSVLQVDKHSADAAQNIIEICGRMHQTLEFIMENGPWDELLYDTSAKSRDPKNERIQNLKSGLLDRGQVQNEAVDVILDAVLKSIDASLDISGLRPRSFLFMGLTSSGRMDFVENLIDYLKVANAESSSPIQVDLSNYTEPQSRLFTTTSDGTFKVAGLFGSPFETYSTSASDECALSILEAVKSCPHTVLIFYHIEKANASVFSSLLKIIDTGILIDQQTLVDFRSTTIIMTTDDLAKKDVIVKLFDVSAPVNFVEDANREGVKRFRSELLHRMDEIVFFDPSSPEQRHVMRLPLKEHALLNDPELRTLLYSLFADQATQPSESLEFQKSERPVRTLADYLLPVGSKDGAG